MFSDTHFHFKMMTEERGVDGVEVLSQLARRDCFFGLDIGTRAGDLQGRQLAVEKCIAGVADARLADKARSFMYFSAGIWPDVESIKDRENQVKLLRDSIVAASADPDQDTLNRKIIAVGECGLDHHWNPSGEDGRCEEDFDEQVYRGERELFEAQIELARELKLPVIVHSRDAFEDTLECINNIGYHNGIIHCYSYGIEEARTFLDLGWYIALGGGITYTKKSKLEQLQQLIRFIPSDRLLTETDAPYLAPVPFRGQANSPVLVEHVFNYIAQARDITVDELNATVDSNIKSLFF
ncbi:MAG: TatD family hydrolase [Treponema sp.]|nr:TatD family hydrolase [Treponema sp.]